MLSHPVITTETGSLSAWSSHSTAVTVPLLRRFPSPIDFMPSTAIPCSTSLGITCWTKLRKWASIRFRSALDGCYRSALEKVSVPHRFHAEHGDSLLDEFGHYLLDKAAEVGVHQIQRHLASSILRCTAGSLCPVKPM